MVEKHKRDIVLRPKRHRCDALILRIVIQPAVEENPTVQFIQSSQKSGFKSLRHEVCQIQQKLQLDDLKRIVTLHGY